MTFDQSLEAELAKPLPRPPDTLYNVFEDTVATLEELVFPVDPDISTCLVSISSRKFFEDVLDQLIRWGMEICGRSGSLRTLTGTLIGNHIEMILWSMEDEFQLIQLEAKKVQKTSNSALAISRLTKQRFSQTLVNLRGFIEVIHEAHIDAQPIDLTSIEGVPLQSEQDVEEREVTESTELDGDGDSLISA